jgi:hypothetical protein
MPVYHIFSTVVDTQTGAPIDLPSIHPILPKEQDIV